MPERLNKRGVYELCVTFEMLNDEELAYLATIWSGYFPNDPWSPKDRRIKDILTYKRYLQTTGRFLLQQEENLKDGFVEIDLSLIEDRLPFPHFVSELRTQPNEVLGCLVHDLQLIYLILF